MITYSKSFSTHAEADAFVAREMRAYHPCGYGTTLRVAATHDGNYLVTGYRYTSCD